MPTITSRKLGPHTRIARTVGTIARRLGGKHVKTIDRWEREGVQVAPGVRVRLPPPDLTLGRIRHWYDETIDGFVAELEAATKAAHQKSET
ncbi:MAG TPA: hypothetical protein VF913_18040 [Xanthobacteraceae bacterium]